MVDEIPTDKTPAQKAAEAGLPVEEAPIVTPIVEPSVPAAPQEVVTPHHEEAPVTHEAVSPVEPVHHTESVSNQVDHPLLDVPHHTANKPRRFKWLGTLVFVVLLFALGIWLSSQLRVFVAPEPTEEVVQVTTAPTPIASTSAVRVASESASVNGWQTLQVSAVGLLLQSVTYQLPQDVVLPVCDGNGCPSSGTNLSGGTRFTVAARGKGERLPDFRGAILTDANGKEFVMKQSRIGGKDVYEYTGDFVGRTGGGYQFSKMRGVLVPVTDTVSVEFNHFAPAGSVSDFAADDVVFDQIIASVKVPTTVTIAPTATKAPTATSSSSQ